MAKSKLTLNCETYLMEEAKHNHINFSKLLEEALQHRLCFLKQDIDGVNIRLIKLDLEQKEKKLLKIQQEVGSLRELIKKYDERKEEIAMKEAERQKEEIQKQKQCYNCGKTMDEEEKRPFPAGVICRACYLSANKEDVKKWMKKPIQNQ